MLLGFQLAAENFLKVAGEPLQGRSPCCFHFLLEPGKFLAFFFDNGLVQGGLAAKVVGNQGAVAAGGLGNGEDGYIPVFFGVKQGSAAVISLGLAPSELAEKSVVTRGDMAILLYRAMRSPEGGSIGVGDAAAGEAGENIPQDGTGSSASGRQGITYNTDGSINIPSDGSRYVPQAGDVIRCDDGSNYTITDVSRYDKNMFASGPVGDLPEPTCDWSLLEQPELPEAEARHYTGDKGDYLRICNIYETRRMLYTLYNAIGDNPVTWKDGAPVLSPKGNQLVHIQLTIPEGESYQMFWPWRASEITNIFNSVPPGTYCMQAWDVFKDGIFQHTEYQIYTI